MSVSWQGGDRCALCLLYKVPSFLPAYLRCFPAADAQLAAVGRAMYELEGWRVAQQRRGIPALAAV